MLVVDVVWVYCACVCVEQSPSEFIIPLEKYQKEILNCLATVGMHFHMVFETEESTIWRCNGFLAQYNSLQIFTYTEQISVVFCYEPAIEFTVLKIQDFKKVVEVLWLCNEESVILADSSTVWYLCLQCRYMGTITGIGDIDPLRWPNSHWCSLKVHVSAAFGSNEFAICDSSLIYTVCE
jgi:hypothetical protein